MSNAARIRIGRVKMKDGGADVRVLNRQRDANRVVNHMRSMMTAVIAGDRPPDGYAIACFWVDEEDPGCPLFDVAYCTNHDALPAPTLMRIAADHLTHDLSASSGKTRALTAMGYTQNPWKPDNVG